MSCPDLEVHLAYHFRNVARSRAYDGSEVARRSADRRGGYPPAPSRARTRMANLLLHLHRRWAAWLPVLAVRLALAVLLVPTGVEKLLGVPFPRRSMEPWAMPFFDMLHSVGPYWRFLGLVQIVAGVCLLVPRFATLGALAALAISVELLVITSALHFRATAVFAAALMVT